MKKDNSDLYSCDVLKGVKPDDDHEKNEDCLDGIEETIVNVRDNDFSKPVKRRNPRAWWENPYFCPDPEEDEDIDMGYKDDLDYPNEDYW